MQYAIALFNEVLDILETETEAKTDKQSLLLLEIQDLFSKAEDKKNIDLPMFYYENAASNIQKCIPEVEANAAIIKHLYYDCLFRQMGKKYRDVPDETPAAKKRSAPGIIFDWEKLSGAFKKGRSDWYKLGEDVVGPGERNLLFPNS